MVNLKLIVSISAVFSERFTLMRMMMQLQWIILSFPVGLSLNRERENWMRL